MLTSFDVMQWLKTLCTSKSINLLNFYCGKLDNKKLNSLGVYSNLSSDIAPFMAIGGIESTTTAEIAICLLIHFNKNYRETEEESLKLFNALYELQPFTINEHEINQVELLVNYPKDVSCDDSGVFERVINFRLNYKK